MGSCALAGLLLLLVCAAPLRAEEPAFGMDRVTAVELVSPQTLPEDLVRSAIGEMVGHPLSRSALRQSLDRLWALGLFAAVWVDEVPAPGGIRLRFHLPRRPTIRSLTWQGEPDLATTDLALATGLELGGDAGADQLEEARRGLLEAYAREGYFAARVEFEARSDPDTAGRDLTVILHPGAPAEIGAIQLTGVTEERARRLAASLGIARGDRYREAAVRDHVRAAQEKLRQEGSFETRLRLESPAWDPATNTVPLVIAVQEGPRYQVEFQGNQALKESALRGHLTFAAAGVVDEAEVANSARQIEAAYREAGYPFVQVAGTLEEKGAAPVIRFRIQEGPQVTVESIDFSGGAAFTAERLRGLMETAPPGFLPILRPGRFQQDVLDRDLVVLEAFYRSQGFAEARLGPVSTSFSADRRRVRIHIPIVEGPRSSVETVAIEGAAVLSTSDILAKLPLKPGDPWSAARVADAQRAIEHLYAQRGYIRVQVAVETTRQDGRVSVVFRIREDGQTRIGRILVSGLVLSDPQVVRREVPFHPGDPFNPEALAEVERRLSRLGLFQRIEVGPLRPPPAPFTDVDIRLQEGSPWHVDLGGGYSTDQKWRGFVEVGHDNLFGTGRSVSLRESYATQGDQTQFTYRHPWLFGTPWQGEASLSREQMKEIGYDRQVTGGALAAHRDLFADRIHGLQGALRYRLDWVQHFHVDPSLAAADVFPGSQIVASLTPSLTLDRRDNPVDPKRGSLHVLSLEGGGTPLGGEVNFLKSRFDTFWYLDWLPPTTFVLSGRIGLATPLGSSPALAIEDRFFAGGSTSIRGYKENRVGPRDADGNPEGGNALLLLNAEWRFPIWRVISGALFVDSGAVTPEVADLGRAAFKTGVGVGLRVVTPVGPLRLDVGYPLNPIPGDGRWQLYFSIGYPF